MTTLHGFLGRPADWDGVLGEQWSRPDWLTVPLSPRGERGQGVRGQILRDDRGESRPATPSGSEMGGIFPGVSDPGLISRDPFGVSLETSADALNPVPEFVASAPFGVGVEPSTIVSHGGSRADTTAGSPPEGQAYLVRLAHHLNQNSEGDTLLGYSMGGRIALHMLLQDPGRWRRAIIVSASPGLRTEGERAERLKGDEAWAARFLHEDWDAVVRDWNAQAVFAHDPPDRLPRREEEFDRHALAAALALGSVAHQANLREKLAALDIPVLWMAGAKDAKYAALAAECAALNPRFSMTTLRTGHRLPWGDPSGFRKAVADFTTIEP